MITYSVGCVLDGGRRVLVLLGAEDLLHRIRWNPSESTGLFEKKGESKGVGDCGIAIAGRRGVGVDPIKER